MNFLSSYSFEVSNYSFRIPSDVSLCCRMLTFAREFSTDSYLTRIIYRGDKSLLWSIARNFSSQTFSKVLSCKFSKNKLEIYVIHEVEKVPLCDNYEDQYSDNKFSHVHQRDMFQFHEPTLSAGCLVSCIFAVLQPHFIAVFDNGLPYKMNQN